MQTNVFNREYDRCDTEGHLDWIGVQGTRKLLEEHLGETPHDHRTVLQGR
jgi:hypothetical protein